MAETKVKKRPNLVIIGVHKAATTSLFAYLKKHPAIFCPGKKEIHYYSPARYDLPLEPIEHYEKHFEPMAATHLYGVDASPSYLYGMEKIIALMKAQLPENQKVILALRHPAERFVSLFKHLKSKLYISQEETFESFVTNCLAHAEEPPLPKQYYSKAINEGKYVEFVAPWIHAYGKDFKIVYFEDVTRKPADVMVDLATWLGLDDAPFRTGEYAVENKSVFANNAVLHRLAMAVNLQFEGFFRNNPKFKTLIRETYYKFNSQKRVDEIRPEDVERIKAYYEPHNRALGELLERYGLPLAVWMK